MGSNSWSNRKRIEPMRTWSGDVVYRRPKPPGTFKSRVLALIMKWFNEETVLDGVNWYFLYRLSSQAVVHFGVIKKQFEEKVIERDPDPVKMMILRSDLRVLLTIIDVVTNYVPIIGNVKSLVNDVIVLVTTWLESHPAE